VLLIVGVAEEAPLLELSGLVFSLLLRIALLKGRTPPKSPLRALLASSILMSAAFWGLTLAALSLELRDSPFPYPFLLLAGLGVAAASSLALTPRLLGGYMLILIGSYLAPLVGDHGARGVREAAGALAIYIFYAFSQSRLIRNLLLQRWQNEATLSQLINTFPGYVTLIGADGTYRFVGDKVSQLTGLTRAQIEGQKVGFLGLDQIFSERLTAFLARSDASEQHEQVIAGRHHLINFHRLESREVLVVSIDMEEVAEARRLQQEQQKIRQHAQQLQMLGQLAAGIAHEINNPLAIALGAAESALRQIAKPTADLTILKKRLESIVLANERAAKIVRSMRLLARDPDTSELSDQSLRQMVDDVLALCEDKLRLQNIDFRLEWNLPQPDLRLRAHPAYLTQILLNLIWNARDATLAGSSEKQISFRIFRSESELTLSVENSGPMIPLEIRDKIMTPFFTTKSEGTGMGLSLSNSWAQAMGASLSFESGPRTTRFDLKIPLPT
jgi:signal transduction histidine kinase